jgi:hypothetical protein
MGSTNKLDAKTLTPASGTNTLVMGLMGLGVLTFFAGLFVGDAARMWKAYLVHSLLFFGLGIGGLFFLVIHYLAGAGWNVAVRRITESLASYVLIGALSILVLIFGLKHIYPWTDHAFMESSHLLHGKIGYFGTGFFIARVLLFLAVVSFFAWRIIRNSTAQDQEGGLELRAVQKPLSALYLVLFAPLFTVFAVDLLKSLDPKWFSTMFGVYVFIGFAQASVAMTIVVTKMLQKHGYLGHVNENHFHDLGKYLFGFSIFWAYIGVSQYLLIWYANLPEETGYYLIRQTPGWVGWSLLLPAVRFILPFLLLLPMQNKRRSNFLVKVAYLVLFGAWLDLYLIVMPNFSTSFGFSLYDAGFLLGFLGLFAFSARKFLSCHNMAPVKDPYLHEALHHHVY